jgi:hypothetical protein
MAPIPFRILNDYIINCLSFSRCPEKRTFEEATVFLPDDVISVFGSPLIEQGVRSAEMPHNAENDHNGYKCDNEKDFHLRSPASSVQHLAPA